MRLSRGDPAQGGPHVLVRGISAINAPNGCISISQTHQYPQNSEETSVHFNSGCDNGSLVPTLTMSHVHPSICLHGCASLAGWAAWNRLELHLDLILGAACTLGSRIEAGLVQVPCGTMWLHVAACVG
jgi:hypothetical protein